MPDSVSNTNNVSNKCPETFEELVSFVNYVQANPDPMFVQISDSDIKIVEELASFLGTNFFNAGHKTSINPFTVIYIDKDGVIKSNMINEKSKIIIYAKRPVHNNKRK